MNDEMIRQSFLDEIDSAPTATFRVALRESLLDTWNEPHTGAVNDVLSKGDGVSATRTRVVTVTDTELMPNPSGRRNRWRMIAAAAAAAVVIGALMIIDWANDGAQPRVPADQPTRVTAPTTAIPTTAPPPTGLWVATSRDPSSYVQVGDAFMDAWVAGDASAQVALIADPLQPGDERIAGRWATAIRDEADLPALADWFRALGWDFTREACHYGGEFQVPPPTTAPPGTAPVPAPDVEVSHSASVWCDYTYDNDLTRAAGRAPIPGHFGIIVQRDHIVALSTEMFDLDAEIWQAFYDWLSRTHPGDVPAMYDSLATSPTPRFDRTSIALWQRHVDEFASSSEAALPWPMPPTRAQFGATARAICAAAAENARGDRAPFQLELPPASVLAQASQDAMEQLRSLPRPNEDRSEIDQLFMQLEQVNERVVADDWFKQADFYDLQQRKNTLGGEAFQFCPVLPLGG